MGRDVSQASFYGVKKRMNKKFNITKDRQLPLIWNDELNLVSGYIQCECHMPNHSFLLSLDKEDASLSLSVQLNHFLPWYKRIWVAVQYIFGRKPGVYYDWDSVILKDEGIKVISDLVRKYKSAKNSNNSRNSGNTHGSKNKNQEKKEMLLD